ncbi:endomucin [Discoglossus pictus]
MESLRAALLFLAVINLCSEPCFTVSTTTTGKVTTTISSAGNKNNEDPVPTNIVTTTISPAGNKNNQDPVPTTTGSSAQNLAVTTKGPTRTTAGSSAQNFAVTTKGSTRATADQTTKATILETVTQAISTASSRNIEQNTSDGNITTNYTHTTQIPAVSTAKKTDAGNKISRDGKHKVVTYVPTDKPKVSTVDFDINSGNNSDQPASEAKNSKANPKGIIMVVCIVLAVIVSIVIVAFLYKMCKRKPPAVENTGAKTSAQNKENVKLISVKTSPQESDGKRTSHNSQMDMFAEC